MSSHSRQVPIHAKWQSSALRHRALFALVPLGPNPAAVTIDVTNGGSGTLSALALSIRYASGQPAGWLKASLSGTTAPAVLTLNATPGMLSGGAYDATVSVSSDAAGVTNSPQRIMVSFTVGFRRPALRSDFPRLPGRVK